MKQISLKIEELFNNCVVVDIDNYKVNEEFFAKILAILQKKVECIFEIGLPCNLEEGQSRETIIQALWEYQKSILPQNWCIHNLNYLFNFPVKIYTSLETIYFYDPKTRIITITDLRGEE